MDFFFPLSTANNEDRGFACTEELPRLLKDNPRHKNTLFWLFEVLETEKGKETGRRRKSPEQNQGSNKGPVACVQKTWN